MVEVNSYYGGCNPGRAPNAEQSVQHTAAALCDASRCIVAASSDTALTVLLHQRRRPCIASALRRNRWTVLDAIHLLASVSSAIMLQSACMHAGRFNASCGCTAAGEENAAGDWQGVYCSETANISVVTKM